MQGSTVQNTAAAGASGFAMGGPWGAAIAAGAALIGGLMSEKAQAEEEERKRRFEGTMMGLNTQKEANTQHMQGQQGAFNAMMEGYGKALLR